MEEVSQKWAVVTGGSRGIGRAIVDELLEDDWAVISISRSGHTGGADRLFSVTADLAEIGGAERAIAEVRALTPRLDLLVNNAGSMQDDEDLWRVSPLSMAKSYQLHTVTPLMLARSFVELFTAAPHPAVVNIGSIYGRVVDPEVAAYGPSKSALSYVNSILAAALAPHVRVNLVAPGHVDTEMTAAAPKDFIDSIVEKTPMRRLVTPAEVVAVVRFLASSETTSVTGASVTIDGGFMPTSG